MIKLKRNSPSSEKEAPQKSLVSHQEQSRNTAVDGNKSQMHESSGKGVSNQIYSLCRKVAPSWKQWKERIWILGGFLLFVLGTGIVLRSLYIQEQLFLQEQGATEAVLTIKQVAEENLLTVQREVLDEKNIIQNEKKSIGLGSILTEPPTFEKLNWSVMEDSRRQEQEKINAEDSSGARLALLNIQKQIENGVVIDESTMKRIERSDLGFNWVEQVKKQNEENGGWAVVNLLPNESMAVYLLKTENVFLLKGIGAEKLVEKMNKRLGVFNFKNLDVSYIPNYSGEIQTKANQQTYDIRATIGLALGFGISMEFWNQKTQLAVLMASDRYEIIATLVWFVGFLFLLGVVGLRSWQERSKKQHENTNLLFEQAAYPMGLLWFEPKAIESSVFLSLNPKWNELTGSQNAKNQNRVKFEEFGVQYPFFIQTLRQECQNIWDEFQRKGEEGVFLRKFETLFQFFDQDQRLKTNIINFTLTLADANQQLFTLVGQDVTEFKRQEMHDAIHQLQMQKASTLDSVTGLPNRQQFLGALQNRIKKESPFALLELDFDNFRLIQDTLGHAVSDQLLRLASTRIFSLLKTNESMSRVGADTFVILLEEYDDLQILKRAEQLIQAFVTPIELRKQRFVLTMCIGIAKYPEHTNEVDDLLQYADTAMQHAKSQNKKAPLFFEGGMYELAARRAFLEQQIREAIRQQSFFIYWQPQWNIKDRTLYGLEVLIRWKHPMLGFISPAEFIPVAEQTGLIHAISTLVFQQAFSTMRRWKQEGLDYPIVSLNLSADQLHNPMLVEELTKMSKKYELDPGRIEFEVTETSIVKNPEEAGQMISEIRKAGFKIAIDDFGTGYSNLSQLTKFPVDTLKIDKAFVDHLATDPQSVAICQAVIALSRAIGALTIAEGVETEEQFAVLKELGTDVVQGYLLARPLPVEDVESILESYKPLQ